MARTKPTGVRDEVQVPGLSHGSQLLSSPSDSIAPHSPVDLRGLPGQGGALCPSHYPSHWPRARKRTEGSLTGFSDVDMPLRDSAGGNKPSRASHGPGSPPAISQGGITRRELTQVPLAAGGSISWLLGLGLGVVCCPSGPAVPNQNRRTEARMQQKDSFSLRSCPHRPQAPVLGLGLTFEKSKAGRRLS